MFWRSDPHWREDMERLCALLGPPPAPLNLAETSADQWTRLVVLASACWLDAMLDWRFRVHGLTDILPEEIRDFAEGAVELGRLRAERQVRQARRVVLLLNQAGIRPVLLKGTAAHLTGLYPDHGARLSGDIDLLIPAAAIAEANAILRRHGYAPPDGPAEDDHRDHKHAPRLLHPDELFGIELHRHLTDAALRPVLPSDEALAGGRRIAMGPLDALVLKRDHQVVHCVANIIGDYWFGKQFALRQLVELRELVRQDGEALNWREIAGRFGQARPSFDCCLLVAARLIGLPPPRIEYGLSARLWAAMECGLMTRTPRLAQLWATLRGLAFRLGHRPPAVQVGKILTSHSPIRKALGMLKAPIRMAKILY